MPVRRLLQQLSDWPLRRSRLIIGTASVTVTLIPAIVMVALAVSGREAPSPPEPDLLQRSTAVAAESEQLSLNARDREPESFEADGSAETQIASAPPAEPVAELQRLSDVLRDRFDESDLIYGSDGAEGGILPLDNGVVPSSGPRFATDWELILPSAGIRATVVQVGMAPGRAMGAPDNPFVIGWYHRSAVPGEPGNALLGGHRDYRDRDGNVGIGVCWELDETRVGDQLIMHNQSANRYYVYDIVDKATLQPGAEETSVYLSQTRESVVTLITCSGNFDEETNSYDLRIVVVALLDAVAAPDV